MEPDPHSGAEEGSPIPGEDGLLGLLGSAAVMPPRRFPSPSHAVAAAVATVAVAGGCGGPGPESFRPPNVLLVLLDDLGKEWLSCYGSESVVTPRIDSVAAQGARFEAFYATPQCTPTRVTLLTGQYPFRHGWVNFWNVPSWGHGIHFDPERNPSLPRVLREAGYGTFVAGKWQLNDFRVQPDVLRELGFDDWCVWSGQEAGNPDSESRYHDPYVHTPRGSETLEGRFGPDVYTDALIEYLRAHRETPLFLYYSMVLPHRPWIATPREPDVLDDGERHAAMVRYADQCLGRILDEIEALGLTRDTLVIVTSDNGTARGQTGSLEGGPVAGGKSTLDEAGICMPLVVSWPGRLGPGLVVEGLADMSDLLPTLTDLARGTPPPGWELDGRSFAPLLRGETLDTERGWILAMGGGPAAVSEEGRVVPLRDWGERALRDRRWKLVLRRKSRAPGALRSAGRSAGGARPGGLLVPRGAGRARAAPGGGAVVPVAGTWLRATNDSPRRRGTSRIPPDPCAHPGDAAGPRRARGARSFSTESVAAPEGGTQHSSRRRP